MKNPEVLTLPRLAGSRQKATILAESLPESLQDTVVVIDASESASVSQGFVDQLLKELIEVRESPNVFVVNSDLNLAERLVLSTKNRSLEDKATINIFVEEQSGLDKPLEEILQSEMYAKIMRGLVRMKPQTWSGSSAG